MECLPPGRPLQRIEIAFERDYSFLMQYAQTLTTLNLVREEFNIFSTISDTLTSIAVFLPALVHVGIIELVKEPSYAAVEHIPMVTLQRFPRIETFILQVRHVIRFTDPTSNHVYELRTDADLEALGSAIMEACPTLQRTVIGAEVDMGHELTCALTRSPEGGIHSEAGTEFDFDAVSMFWNLE
ncbi:hypothetical protein DFH09DRAFT_137938 [Mycena vulgaris]|nr:hypothetical protein DFH09DRAFT_137938 [Mycena vulgaris]